MTDIEKSIYKSPLRNLNTKKLLQLKNFMNYEEYLEYNFTHVHKTKYDLYIVATSDKPTFSYYDMAAYDIFNSIKTWVDKLIIEPNQKNASFNQLLNNYVIVYGDYNFLKEKQKELLLIFNKIIIPIYNTDYLYFNYNNSYILYPNFNETNWRPIYNEEYNQIIENLMFFIFDILVILYPTQWSYLNNDFLYNYIYKDVNDKLYIINNYENRKKVIKTYLYQTWLILMHSDSINDFLNQINQKYSQGDLETYQQAVETPEVAGNIKQYWTSNRQKIVIFLNTYINKNYIINYENYKKIDILNDVKKQLFFNYNTYENNDDKKISIIIGLISFIVISIAIIFWLYFRKKHYVKTTENPFKIVMN